MTYRPKANVLANFAMNNIQARAETIIKAISFFLKDIMKTESFVITIEEPVAEERGVITIRVFDLANNEVYMKPKAQLMSQLIGFIGVIERYEIKFAEANRG